MSGALILDSEGLAKALPANLRRLVAAHPDIALPRSDLAALDVIVHGALFSGIGADSANRHSIPPGEVAVVGEKKDSGATYPNVLLPSLMSLKGTRAPAASASRLCATG
ncbi:hypothetical protein [Streptomyces tubercidicus]|uniref:hypothetical protein n=1 Tax=Streptomyces tubercidicus TaxID=47759 RepID=UPI0037BC2B44